MLEGKDYQRIDIVFPLICAFVNEATGYTKDEDLIKGDSLYSELLDEI